LKLTLSENYLAGKSNMGFYQFLEEVGVHRFDYSGEIDLDMGISRMEQVEKIFFFPYFWREAPQSPHRF
jgi:hypothetical protein